MILKEPLNGETFSVNIEEVTQDRLNGETAKSYLTAEQLKAATNTIVFDQARTTRIKGEKHKFVPPNLENATPVGLVDMLGDVREKMNALKREEKYLLAALKARIPTELIKADNTKGVGNDGKDND